MARENTFAKIDTMIYTFSIPGSSAGRAGDC